MEPKSNIQDDWQSCRPGMVGQLVQDLQARRNAVVVQRRMVAVVLLMMAAFSGYYFVGVLPTAEPNYGGIVCSKVRELGPEFVAGTLDAEVAARIRAHLDQCQQCQQWKQKMIQMSADQAESTASSSTSSVARLERDSARPVLNGLAMLTR